MFVIVYRTGGTANFKWHRSAKMVSYAVARKTSDSLDAAGYVNYILDADISDAIGLPQVYGFNNETDEIKAALASQKARRVYLDTVADAADNAEAEAEAAKQKFYATLEAIRERQADAEDEVAYRREANAFGGRFLRRNKWLGLQK